MMYYNCTDDPNVKCRDYVETRYYHNLANPGARYWHLQFNELNKNYHVIIKDELIISGRLRLENSPLNVDFRGNFEEKKPLKNWYNSYSLLEYFYQTNTFLQILLLQ